MSRTLILAAAADSVPLDTNSGYTLSIPSATTVTFNQADSNDALAEMCSIMGDTVFYDNLASLNYALANGSSTDAITYGPFGQKTTTSLGTTPTLVSAVIENAAPTILVLTYSANVVATAYDTGVSVTVNAVARTVSSAARQSNHAIIWVTLASGVTTGQTVLVSFATNQYSQAAKTGSDLRSESGGAYVAAYTGHAVTNNTV